MSVEMMRAYLKERYQSGTIRGKRIDDMTQNQVLAIYLRILRSAS